MDYQGLNTLFQTTGPGTNALNQGIQDYQTQLEKQQALDFAAQNNPLKVQNQSLVNQGLEAELPGKQATSRKQVAEADVTEATKDSNIKTKLSDNELTQLGNTIKTAEAHHAQAVQAVAYIGQGPDAEARKLQLLRSGQIPPGPLYDAISSTSAKDLPSKLESASQAIARSKDAYIQKIGAIQATGKEQRLLEDQQYRHGKYLKSNVLSWSQKFETLSPDKQMITIAGALNANKSPISGEPLTDDERQYFTARYKQAEAIINAQNAARSQAQNQGITPTVTNGNVTLQPRTPLPGVGITTETPTPGAPSKPAALSDEDLLKKYLKR